MEKRWFERKKISKKKLKELEVAAKLLEQAAADAFAALWYAQQDFAPRGAQWGFASKACAEQGHKAMSKLFQARPPYE